MSEPAASRSDAEAPARRPGWRAGRGGLLMAAVGLIGALAASSCCLAPFVLFALGVSGAWIGRLTALGPYQPVVVAATLAALAGGFVLVHRRPAGGRCEPGSSCAAGGRRRAAQVALWAATALVAAALVGPRLILLFVGP